MTPSSLNRETNELMQTRRIAASLPVALCSIHEEKIAGVSFGRHRTLNRPEEVDDLLDGCITERHVGWALHNGFRTIDHDSVGIRWPERANGYDASRPSIHRRCATA